MLLRGYVYELMSYGIKMVLLVVQEILLLKILTSKNLQE